MTQGNQCSCGVNILLVTFVSILCISLPLSFTIAVLKHHVAAWFPAISDTATKSPESNIFGLVLNIDSFLGTILVYVRYLQLSRDVERLDDNSTIICFNRWGLAFGLLTMSSSCVVANFPETQVPVVHATGSVALFFFANIYAWIQTIISFHMKRFRLIGPCVCITRLLLSLLTSTAFVVALALTIYGMRKWPGNRLYWNSDDPAHTEHVIADVFEWLIVLCYVFMFLSLIKEFHHGRLQITFVTGNKHDL